MPQPKVTLRKSDYARALGIAKKFNIKSAARPSGKVQAVLKDAVAFLTGVAVEIKKGNVIETGSGWHGPDEFLSAASAESLARKKDQTDHLLGSTVDVSLIQKNRDGISEIRRAFKLSSEKQAAGLALRVYERLTDGLWRGNSFYYASSTDSALDTDPIKKKLFPNWQP
jgi:hypothetical protein